MDRVRRLLVAIVVVVVAALVVLVVTVRPGLRDDADALDTSWKPLVPALDTRYQRAPWRHRRPDRRRGRGPERPAGADPRARPLDGRAHRDRRRGPGVHGQPTRGPRGAGGGTGRHPRLGGDPALQLTLTAFNKQRPPENVLKTYNDDVLAYQHERDGFWSRIVARLDGYPMRPTLQLKA